MSVAADCFTGPHGMQTIESLHTFTSRSGATSVPVAMILQVCQANSFQTPEANFWVGNAWYDAQIQAIGACMPNAHSLCRVPYASYC